MMLRQAILMSSMLLNFEASLKITKENMKLLKRVDENLLRRILGAPKSTPVPSLYLETGSIPVYLVIKGRHLLFLHYLLNQPENSLLSKLLYDQIENPMTNDWFSVTKENLSELGLDHYSLQDIKNMKKNTFKKLIKTACEDVAFMDLKNEIAERNLKKIKSINYPKFELQRYMLSNALSTIIMHYQ